MYMPWIQQTMKVTKNQLIRIIRIMTKRILMKKIWILYGQMMLRKFQVIMVRNKNRRIIHTKRILFSNGRMSAMIEILNISDEEDRSKEDSTGKPPEKKKKLNKTKLYQLIKRIVFLNFVFLWVKLLKKLHFSRSKFLKWFIFKIPNF